MLNKEEIVKRLRTLKVDLKKRFKVKKIGLFGSYVNESQKKESDIDILVEFENGADLFDLSGLSIFLEEIFKQKVDIVSKNALRSELKEIILDQVIYI
jgi:hypothetical protein